jgi:hypothetical protein
MKFDALEFYSRLTTIPQVWHLIKLEQFPTFWSKLSNAEFVKGASPDTDIVRWAFKDGTVLEVKQEEHSSVSLPLDYCYRLASI